MGRRASSTQHVLRTLAAGTVIAMLAVVLVAGTAFAGKARTSGSSLSMVALNSTDGLAHWGGKIRFNVSTSATYPVVSVTCAKNGATVYGSSLPYYWPNPWDSDGTFILSSAAWTSGAADCTAALKTTSNSRTVTLATTSFHVYP